MHQSRRHQHKYIQDFYSMLSSLDRGRQGKAQGQCPRAMRGGARAPRAARTRAGWGWGSPRADSPKGCSGTPAPVRTRAPVCAVAQSRARTPCACCVVAAGDGSTPPPREPPAQPSCWEPRPQPAQSQRREGTGAFPGQALVGQLRLHHGDGRGQRGSGGAAAEAIPKPVH